MDILMGGGVVRPASSRYEEYAEKRISLMKSYAKNEMSRHSYLIAIGGQTWKQSHDMVRKSTSDSTGKRRKGSRTASAAEPDPLMPDDTRAVSPVHSGDSDVDQPDPFPRMPVSNPVPIPRIAAAHQARRKQKKCPPRPWGCGKGFVISKNTWIECTGPCNNMFHKKCVTSDEMMREPFICFTCLPDAVLAPGKLFNLQI